MSHGRFGRVLGVAGLVGIMVLPFAAPTTSSADTTPSGLAKASSLSLSLSPQALAVLAIPAQLQSALNALPCGVGTALGSALTQTTTVALDAASNDGTLNSVANDLLTGEATSEAVHIGLQGIDQVLSGVNGILKGDLSCLTGGTGTSLPSLPTNVTDLIGTLQGQLGAITAPLAPYIGQLNGQLNINQVLHVLLDQQPQTKDLLDITAPLISTLQLGPYDATAVSQAGAQKYNVATGPQLEAHNTTTNLGIGQNIPLGGLGNIGGTLSSLVSTLQGDLSALTGANNTLSGLTGGGTPASSAVSTVCTTISGLLPQVNCSSLPINSNPTGALGSLTALTPQLSSLQTSLQNLLNGLPGLQNVLGQLPTSLNLADLIQTAGDTSSVLTQPKNGGVHSLATTSLLDLKVLQLLHNDIPGLPVAPLLELKGVSSSAEALVNGTDTSAPTGTVSLGELDVLGTAIKLTGLGTGQTITVPTPVGDVTVRIAIGQPQTINNTPQRKTIQASALTVQLINGDANGNNPITLLGVKEDPTILDLQVAGTQVDDAMTPVASQVSTQAACTTCNTPSTGMLGPIGFAGVGFLGLTAAGLRIAARRNRRAAAAAGIDSEPAGSEPESLSID